MFAAVPVLLSLTHRRRRPVRYSSHREACEDLEIQKFHLEPGGMN